MSGVIKTNQESTGNTKGVEVHGRQPSQRLMQMFDVGSYQTEEQTEVPEGSPVSTCHTPGPRTRRKSGWGHGTTEDRSAGRECCHVALDL